MKKIIFLKTRINSKNKAELRRKNLYFCIAHSFSSIDMNIDSESQIFRPLAYLRRAPFFPVLCEQLVFHNELKEKYTTSTPVIFGFTCVQKFFFPIGPKKG